MLGAGLCATPLNRGRLTEDSLAAQTDQGESQISFVVIGKNEARNLGRCAASIRRFQQAAGQVETIYVDSASTDQSIELARNEFDTIVALKASPHLNAGAARRVGTQYASGKWVAYLDGDMELREEAWPILMNLVATADQMAGVCGQTLNVFPDGRRAIMHLPRNVAGSPCRDFGGAVVLPRQALLEAGNWSPRLFAYEETELHTRLHRQGVSISWHAIPIVNHYTEAVPAGKRLRGQIIPWGSHLGKKFFGAGQLVREILRRSTVTSFGALRPEAIIIIAGILAGLAAAPWSLPTGALLILLAWIGAALASGARSAIQYTLWLPQVLFGLFRYPSGFEPEVDTVIRRDQALDPGLS
jgi:glycosyltransferase involved in cell wall biosynthesis